MELHWGYVSSSESQLTGIARPGGFMVQQCLLFEVPGFKSQSCPLKAYGLKHLGPRILSTGPSVKDAHGQCKAGKTAT